MTNRELMNQINYSLGIIDSAYAGWAKRIGLNYNSLMIICVMADCEVRTQKQICERLHLPKTTVHSILQDFMEKEYLILEVNKENRKEKIIHFTDNGKEYFDSVLQQLYEVEDRVMEKLGHDNCKLVRDVVAKFGEIMSEEIQG